MSTKDLDKNILIHKVQNWETTQLFINSQMDKQIVVYRSLLSSKNK